MVDYERSTRASGGSAASVASSRSDLTRAKLMAVAEKLFSEKGVQAVSLNEINKAAEQRHGSACQYHFGNKEGLIQAILDKHVPSIAGQRDLMFDEMDEKGDPPLIEKVIAAFVRPVAAKLLDPDGGKEFVRLNAQLVAVHTVSMRQNERAPFFPPQTARLNHMLERSLEQYAISSDVARHRLIVASVMLYHGLADYSHILEAAGALDQSNVQIFASDLEAMIVAALIAPYIHQENSYV